MKKWPDELAKEEIHLWVCEGVLERGIEGAEGVLSADELKRVRGYRREEDRRRYGASLLLQRMVLGCYLKCSPKDLVFSRNEWGKPSLAEEDLEFSLSRSGGLAVLALSGGGQIGVDVERVADCDPKIAERFSEKEREFVENASDPREAIFHIWTRKEAYIKALGRGLSHPLAEFEVLSDRVRDWSESAPRKPWFVNSLNLPVEGFLAALAGESLAASVKVIKITYEEVMQSLR